MIDAYVAKGPNPMKLLIFLQEVPLEHRRIWLDLSLGEHRTADFLLLSPSAKVPAMVDHAPESGEQVQLFESAAILIYLAEKSGQLLPSGPASARADVLKWLVWQVATFGPMSGQAGHFRMYAPKSGNDYAFKRYNDENRRLYAIFDRHLEGRHHVAGEYSIADIALFPWVFMHKVTGIELRDYPNVQRWMSRVAERPAVERTLSIIQTEPPLKTGSPEQFRKNLFHDHCADEADATVR